MQILSQFGEWLWNCLGAGASERALVRRLVDEIGLSPTAARRMLFGDDRHIVRDHRALALAELLHRLGADSPFDRQELMALMLRSMTPDDLKFIVDAIQVEIDKAWKKSQESSAILREAYGILNGSDAESAVQSIQRLIPQATPERWAALQAVFARWDDSKQKEAVKKNDLTH
jgi:hypothetical protein